MVILSSLLNSLSGLYVIRGMLFSICAFFTVSAKIRANAVLRGYNFILIHNIYGMKVVWVLSSDGHYIPYIDNGLFLDGRKKTLAMYGFQFKGT